MPKYLVRGSYTTEGVKGLVKDGGSKRRAAVAAALKGLGGTLEAFYYTFGDSDVIGIGDMPDNTSAAAFSLAIASTGLVEVQTTVLITPEEMDQATKKTVSYEAPGR